MNNNLLGFSCMRLPMHGDAVDTEEFSRMIDAYLEAGFNYFDTAHVYLDGKSETALRECLTSRYPREKYVLTDKISECFQTEADLRPYFDTMLEACGVEYFDYLLLHNQNSRNYDKYTRCRAYEFAQQMKAEGKVRHVGISFHDTPEFLERILREHPEIEIVQIQFNYVDYENPSVESRRCYEVCRKYGKPVLVMEPVKGGSLTKLPAAAQQVFDNLQGGSPASYAIRFAAGFEGMFKVLSGMSDMAQMEENIGFMRNFQPLNEQEQAAVEQVREIFRTQDIIPCTACRYCVSGCPQQIAIPDLFACYNSKKQYMDWGCGHRYKKLTENGGKPANCVQCGQCEEACPQNLKIRDLLQTVAKEFEKTK